MSRAITKEEFLKRFTTKFPSAEIEIIDYVSLKKPCKVQCLKCGKIIEKTRAEGFLTAWPCCEGKNETKVDLVKRLCDEDGHYKFIKQIDSRTVIIKHLDCGNEMTKSIQAAISAPCSCAQCGTQGQKLRISIQEAQKQLDETFEGNLEILFFDGVDSKASQYRCKKCGLIFNQSHYNLLAKCRGCPKCDQRRSKGELSMRKWLEERQITYKEQISFAELGGLRFDFGVYEGDILRALIEVQGEQHFREVFHYPSRPDYFKTQIMHDEQKREFCKEHNIPLFEIINNSGKLTNLDILDKFLSNSTTISAKESTSQANGDGND